MRKFVLFLAGFSLAAADLDQLRNDFQKPPADYRPHTRWWWMGNALRKQDISFQLSQMAAQGIGGVEQITMPPVYAKGNIPFLSDEFLGLLNHAIAEAKARGMEFSMNFGGPGWIWGGEWVPHRYRNRNLVASAVEVRGPRRFAGALPLDVVQNPKNLTESLRRIREGDAVVAVIAGELDDGRLRGSSLTDLTAQVRERRLTWQVPAGKWRLMVFWMAPNGDPAVDHLSREAMEFYCNYVGERFRKAFGAEFGKTVESFFMDSFEVPVFRNGLYWTPKMLDLFQQKRGYSLTRYLPALWWEVDHVTPKIRYDLNLTMHEVGMHAFFDTFAGWCRRNSVKARIQPYGFPTDILEGAGAADIPEMEITAGEKDAVPWFDTRIGPRTYTASGARLYGRKVISVEAYTYMHWEQARDTLEELKIASDIFLRAGATKFYNHGYTATPEREFVPSRRFGAEMLLSHVNTWWPYYRHLADYVARSSVMLRYGRPVVDIAVYSPLANQWTLDVLNPRRWTRDFDWAELARYLLGNGYDFDLINDDVLERRANIQNGRIAVADMSYRVLVIPNIRALPVETYQRIEQFVRGGGVVIATDRVPESSTGMANYAAKDAEVKAISGRLFQSTSQGQGNAYFVKSVIERRNVLDLQSSVFDPFVNAIRKHVKPDFGIDFVRHAMRENNGLLFSHRAGQDGDVYFVSNVQDRPVDTRIAFRVTDKAPAVWNPYNGEFRKLYEYDVKTDTTVVPIRLAPFESTFIVFSGKPDQAHTHESDFAGFLNAGHALAARNGPHSVDGRTISLSGVPSAFQIAGPWRLSINEMNKTLNRLVSWTEDAATRHFSGTAAYSVSFDLPSGYASPDLRLQLTLGDVGNVAEVEVNGQPAGVIWMRDQTLDVTNLLRTGSNSITAKVTNLLINRVSAWTKAPPLPPDLAPIYGRGVSDDDAQFRRLYGFSPLPRSGLLGPVLITPLKVVAIH
ncbi:MAG: hypothetical protein IT168_15470 [Bryobacterales bacterium]|nr:hypothetical protein [Bryobacterales bacterium]